MLYSGQCGYHDACAERQTSSDGQSALSSDFQRALTREILKTELLRVKALMSTTTCSAIRWTVYILVVPRSMELIWHGNLNQ